MADAAPTPATHPVPVTFDAPAVTGNSVTVFPETHVIDVSTEETGASSGYIAWPNSGSPALRGQISQPAGNTETDLPHPTTSYEVRFDVDITTLVVSRTIAAIHSDGTGGARAWYALTDGATASELNYWVRVSGSANEELTTSSYFETGRKQYRFVHSGTTVTAYKRDATAPLAEDSGWTQADQNTSAADVSTMNNPSAGAWVFFRRTTGNGYESDIKLYEHRITIDGTLESSVTYGAVTLDTVNDELYDDQGNVWNWSPAADPTQTAGGTGGVTRGSFPSASSTVTLTTHTVGVAFPAMTPLSDPPAFFISVDWDDDGAYTEVTDDTLQVGYTEIGRDPNKPQATPIVADATIQLTNTSGDYYPDNTGSPLNGYITTGHALRVQSATTGTVYTLFEGHIFDYHYDVTLQQAVTINARGPLSNLVGKRISTLLYQGITTGEAINHVLDAAGSTAPRDLDVGSTTIRYWWVDNVTAYQALTDLVASEGPDSLVYVNPDTGAVTFRDRHHRQTDTNSTSNQSTWYSTTPEPAYTDFDLRYGWDDIINAVELTVQERTATDNYTTVWESDGVPFTVPANTTVEVVATAADPFTGVDEVEYETTAGDLATVGVSRASGQSTTISLTAGGADRVITSLKLIGQSLPVTSTVSVVREDTPSVAQHGKRNPGLSAPWVSVAQASDLIDMYLNRYANPSRTVTVGFVGDGDTTRYTNQVARGISDKVTVVEPRSSTNRVFHVDTIRHEVTQAGLWHKTVFTLGDTVTPLVADADLFILDSATNGVLGTDKLGY